MKVVNSKQVLDIFSNKKLEDKKEEPKEKIIIDYREKNSLVASYLVKQNFEIEFKELKIGDYIVKDTIIERKTVQDFLNSMINHRLLNQIEELKQYENKLIIIEGISEQELYSEENKGINANAIRGFLLSIVLKHKIPVIFSQNQEDTAKFINVLSNKKEKEINLNAKKKTLNRKEQLQFIIESFPGIGPKKAKKLLEKFGSIQNVILASTEDLKEILGIHAGIVREIIERKY
jgi:ERCC4-type nuclease